ncbi:MAG: class I SAM-dependent methyltransferase [Ignavibacteria bacterium]|jgi:SAM-dependent methyltransferase
MRVCPNCKSNEYKLRIKEKEFLIVECSSCSLVFLLNPPDESVIYEDYYQIDFKGKDYNESSSVPHLREIFEINKQRTALIKAITKGEKDLNILDIGCGSGLFLKSCKDEGIKGEGIDISNTALSFARDEFGLTVYNKSVEKLIEGNKKYNLITLWHVLEHFLLPMDELRKIKELLSPKGILIIEVPNLKSLKFRLSGNKWKGGNHPLYHRSFFTSETLLDTLTGSGFNDASRLNFTYSLSNRSFLFNISKKVFNTFGADAFLDFIARND